VSDERAQPYQNLTTTQVKAMLDRGETFRFIDVREADEYAVARIEGSELLPLSQAPTWIPTLKPDETIVFFCHSGFRSQQIASYLARQQGFTNAANMLGGIDDWSIRVDPTVPRY
jgi:adenylyltransferase/sulfurtransferase